MTKIPEMRKITGWKGQAAYIPSTMIKQIEAIVKIHNAESQHPITVHDWIVDKLGSAVLKTVEDEGYDEKLVYGDE
jgi:hypothetical protein